MVKREADVSDYRHHPKGRTIVCE